MFLIHPFDVHYAAVSNDINISTFVEMSTETIIARDANEAQLIFRAIHPNTTTLTFYIDDIRKITT